MRMDTEFGAYLTKLVVDSPFAYGRFYFSYFLLSKSLLNGSI